jgi:two-component system, NtrC family, nitrogen regulation sensor histidine kinase NtrY
MDKRIYLYTVIGFLFFGLAFYKNTKNTKESNLQDYAHQIQQTLTAHQGEVRETIGKYAEKPSFLLESNLLAAAFDESKMQILANKPYTLLFFQGKNLKCWSNNRVAVRSDQAEGFVDLDEGYYHVSKVNLDNNFSVLSLIPLKRKFKIKNEKYLKETFIASELIPSDIWIQENPTAFSITSNNGQTIYLDAATSVPNANDQYQLFILLMIGFVFFCMTISHISQALVKGKHPIYSLVFFIISFAMVKFALTYLDLNDRFSLLPLFDKSNNESSVFNTLPGDMLVNIFLLLWLIVFFYKDMAADQLEKASFKGKIALNLVFSTMINVGLLLVIYFHKGLIMKIKEDFDFENIFYINFSSVITIMSLLLLWVVLFLFNYRIMRNVVALGLTTTQKIATLIFSIFLIYPVIVYSDFNLNSVAIVLFLFAFSVLLDIFIENENGLELPWLLIWLIISSFTSSILLYNYRKMSNLVELKNTVGKLSELKDVKAQERLDQLVGAYHAGKDTLTSDSMIKKRLVSIFNKDNYLADNYQLSISENREKLSEGDARIIPIENENNEFVYENRVILDSLRNGFRLELTRQANKNYISDEEQESLLAEPYKGIRNLNHIDYAVFRKNICLEQKGFSYEKIDDVAKIPMVGQLETITENNDYTEVSGHFEKDVVVVVRHKYDGIHKIAYLFAYLFIFTAGIAFFLAVFNTFANVIDGFRFPRNWSMNFKIHATIIGLVVFACIVIAFITILYSNNTAINQTKEEYRQKLLTITSQVQGAVAENESGNINFQALGTQISNTHKIDVNFYDTTGHLITNFSKVTFKKHLKAPLINSIAFENLVHQRNWSMRLDDQIGGFSYQSGFARVEKNGQLVALMEVPFYGRTTLKENELSDLMGMLMTVYVLLLIPTIAFAYSTTKLIMKPLHEVGEKLREVEFGLKPTKIEWSSKDELGDLITEYNNMLVKLEESGRVLQENAQESAWRVMAKQVCHDIKNPLTPMQLSVQMLSQMTDGGDIESARLYMKKMTKTLEEQIKNLNDIATRFGEYAGNTNEDAKPKLNKEILNFGEFVKVNATLYETNEHPNTKVNIVIPSEAVLVKIDPSQMSRVVNNLIKNAIQAIPSNREGRVDVFVYEEDGRAITRISDNGVGIPKDQMDKIFKPNFTTKGTGSGIGLSVSYRMVKEVSGMLRCESVLGQGSDFYIELPIADIDFV